MRSQALTPGHDLSAFDKGNPRVPALSPSLTDVVGKNVWDTSEPKGQLRREVAKGRAKGRLGFETRMPFDEGSRMTIG
jgi:hypothetical protein